MIEEFTKLQKEIEQDLSFFENDLLDLNIQEKLNKDLKKLFVLSRELKNTYGTDHYVKIEEGLLAQFDALFDASNDLLIKTLRP